MANRNVFFIVIAALGCNLIYSPSHSQTPRQFKRHVEALLDNIDKAECAYRNSNDDSAFSILDRANASLADYLLTTLPAMPQSLTMKFHDDRMWVTTSPDRKIRSWAWNTWTGGSMPQIDELVEYKSSNGIQVVNPFEDREGGNDTWINEIKSVSTNTGHTYYLVISGWVGDGMHHGEQANIYEIENNTLNTKVPLFQTKKGILNEISYYSASESDHINRFKLSPDGRTFLVPLAYYKSKADKENDNVTLTRKSLKYEFDGEHFVYRGVTKN